MVINPILKQPPVDLKTISSHLVTTDNPARFGQLKLLLRPINLAVQDQPITCLDRHLPLLRAVTEAQLPFIVANSIAMYKIASFRLSLLFRTAVIFLTSSV